MKKAFVLLLLLAPAAAADYGYLWYDITVAQLPAGCATGQLFVVNDGADITDCSAGGGNLAVVCRCDESESGYNAVSILNTHAQLDRIGLPSCSSTTQDQLRVDASGDLCFCNGSAWDLVSGGGACVEAAASYLLTETSDYVLMETGDQIILEN